MSAETPVGRIERRKGGFNEETLAVNRSIEENCGIFGTVGRENASRIVFFALYALNHSEYCHSSGWLLLLRRHLIVS
jgi:hypothetical protein